MENNICRVICLLIWRAGGNCWDLPVSFWRGRDVCANAPCPEALSPCSGTSGRQQWEVWEKFLEYGILSLLSITPTSAVPRARENIFCFSSSFNLNPHPWLVLVYASGVGCTDPPNSLNTLGFAVWVLGRWRMRQGLLMNHPSRGCCPPRGSLETSQGCSLHHPGAGSSLGTGSLSIPGRWSLVSPSPEGADTLQKPLKPCLRNE